MRYVKVTLYSILVILILSTPTAVHTDVLTEELNSNNEFVDHEHPSRVAYKETVQRKLVNVGRAPFAIASERFQCKKFMRSLNKLDFLHISWVYNTWGDDYDCLKELMNDERLITLQTHLINEPSHRNKRLEPHEFLYNIESPHVYSQLLVNRDKKLKRRFQKYVEPLQNFLYENLQPQTECLISPGLESNTWPDAMRVLVHWTREAFPMCRVVWNPVNMSHTTVENTRADLLEKHTWFPQFNTKQCTFNNDGSDINFPNRKSIEATKHEQNPNTIKNYLNVGVPLQSALEEYANRCEFVFLWVMEDNCYAYNDDQNPWPKPSERSCDSSNIYRLTAKQVENVHQNGVKEPEKFVYSKKEKSSFSDCDEIRNPNDGFKKNFILKQSEFADRGGVIILPRDLTRSSSITVVHKNKIIDTYSYSGKYTSDNSNRDFWRSQKTILQYPLKVAIKIKHQGRNICYKVNNPRIRND